MSKSDYYTRDAANEGVRLDLVRPDETESDDYLCVRGMDSDVFRAALSKVRQDGVSIGLIKDEKERETAHQQASLKLLATLIKSWSFDEELTIDSGIIKKLKLT